MNIRLKKALYESIMKNVSKQVKKALNEAFTADDIRGNFPNYNAEAYEKIQTVWEKYKDDDSNSYEIETPEDAYEHLNDILWWVSDDLGYFDPSSMLADINPAYYDDPDDGDSINPAEEQKTITALCNDYPYFDLILEYYRDRKDNSDLRY